MPDRNHAGEQHPDEWRRDLNPHPQAGQNHGEARLRIDDAATAAELKAAQPHLAELDDSELRRIPILPAGARLQQGGVYLDLRDPQRSEFTARGDQQARDGDLIVPKDEVDYSLWNRLLGVSTPARLDRSEQG